MTRLHRMLAKENERDRERQRQRMRQRQRQRQRETEMLQVDARRRVAGADLRPRTVCLGYISVSKCAREWVFVTGVGALGDSVSIELFSKIRAVS